MNPTVQLLQFLLLANFPSGSSINYDEQKLYIVGDDARTMLVLDRHYQPLDSIRLFDHPEKRIPKDQKMDIESSAILGVRGSRHVVAFGSASTNNRKRILVVPLTEAGAIDRDKPIVSESITAFVDRVITKGVSEVNIEGASVIHRSLVLANRGNGKNPNNHLIVTEDGFWNRQKESSLRIIPIKSMGSQQDFLGISEVCYVAAKDLLLLAFTSEATSNAYDDGEIGDSYLGWAFNVAGRIKQPNLKLDGMINLSDANIEFKNQKIEGICVESASEGELLIHLISDNDNGESKLFKALLKLQPKN